MSFIQKLLRAFGRKFFYCGDAFYADAVMITMKGVKGCV